MRFPSKQSLVRVSLLFLFALPTIAQGDENTDTQSAQDVADRKEHFLALSEAKQAFGKEFSIGEVNSQFVLYGGTSKVCRDKFEIETDGAKGEYRIHYLGDAPDCLYFDRVTKDLPSADFVKLQSGVKSEEVKMIPTGTFDKVNLVVDDPYSSKGLYASSDELTTDDGKSLSHENEKEVADRKKQEAADKKQKMIDAAFTVVTKCHRGLKELDVGDEALARLAEIPEIVKEKGEEWFADNAAKFREEKFKACRVQMLKAKVDEIASSECESRLQKIADADPKYTSRIKDIYMQLVNRYAHSASLGMEEAYDAAMDTIAKIREFGLSEKEEADLLAVERNINLQFMQKAALEGVKSENFIAMKDKMLEYMLAEDAEGCLTGEGAIVPAQRMNKACAGSQWLSLQFSQQIGMANANQALLDKQALASQLMTDYDACSALRASAAQAGTTLDAANDARCKPIEAQVNAQKTATANVGLNANGFGTIMNGTNTTAYGTTTNTATNPTNSGLMNSVYTSQSSPQQTVTIPVNTVQQTGQVTPAVTNTAPVKNTVSLHH